MTHYLYLSKFTALEKGTSSLTFVGTFPSYSAAASFAKSEVGLMKSLIGETYDVSNPPIFLIIPEKGIVLATPAKKDLLKLTKLADALATQEAATTNETHA